MLYVIWNFSENMFLLSRFFVRCYMTTNIAKIVEFYILYIEIVLCFLVLKMLCTQNNCCFVTQTNALRSSRFGTQFQLLVVKVLSDSVSRNTVHCDMYPSSYGKNILHVGYAESQSHIDTDTGILEGFDKVPECR